MKTLNNNQVQTFSDASSLTSIYKSESSGRYSAKQDKYSLPERQKSLISLRKKLENKGIEQGTKAEEKELRTEEKWKNGLQKNRKIVKKLDWLETEEGQEFLEDLKTRKKKEKKIVKVKVKTREGNGFKHSEIIKRPRMTGWKQYFKRYKEAIKECGQVSSLRVCLDCETRYSLTPRESCSKRICPLCARRQTKEWFWKYAPRILKYAKEKRSHVPVHITLTLESKDAEHLGSEIIRLQESFLKLRRRVFWKNAFSGAISSIEVTWNKETGRPHPHIHILAFRENWVSQEALSQEWEDITGSYIVWIKRAYSKKNKSENTKNKWEPIETDKGLIDAIIEASKYCVKSEDLSELSGRELADFIVAVRGRNLKDVLGGLRGYSITEEEELSLIEEIKKLQEVEEEKDSEQCWGCGSVRKVILRVEYSFESDRMVWIDSG